MSSMGNGGLMYGEPSLPLGVADEYDPLFPNDFEELSRMKRERRRMDVSNWMVMCIDYF